MLDDEDIDRRTPPPMISPSNTNHNALPGRKNMIPNDRFGSLPMLKEGDCIADKIQLCRISAIVPSTGFGVCFRAIRLIGLNVLDWGENYRDAQMSFRHFVAEVFGDFGPVRSAELQKLKAGQTAYFGFVQFGAMETTARAFSINNEYVNATRIADGHRFRVRLKFTLKMTNAHSWVLVSARLVSNKMTEATTRIGAREEPRLHENDPYTECTTVKEINENVVFYEPVHPALFPFFPRGVYRQDMPLPSPMWTPEADSHPPLSEMPAETYHNVPPAVLNVLFPPNAHVRQPVMSSAVQDTTPAMLNTLFPPDEHVPRPVMLSPVHETPKLYSVALLSPQSGHTVTGRSTSYRPRQEPYRHEHPLTQNATSRPRAPPTPPSSTILSSRHKLVSDQGSSAVTDHETVRVRSKEQDDDKLAQRLGNDSPSNSYMHGRTWSKGGWCLSQSSNARDQEYADMVASLEKETSHPDVWQGVMVPYDAHANPRIFIQRDTWEALSFKMGQLRDSRDPPVGIHKIFLVTPLEILRTLGLSESDVSGSGTSFKCDTISPNVQKSLQMRTIEQCFKAATNHGSKPMWGLDHDPWSLVGDSWERVVKRWQAGEDVTTSLLSSKHNESEDEQLNDVLADVAEAEMAAEAANARQGGGTSEEEEDEEEEEVVEDDPMSIDDFLS